MGTAPAPLWREEPGREPRRSTRELRSGFTLLVVAADVAVIWASFLTAHWIRYASDFFPGGFALGSLHILVLATVSLTWTAIFGVSRLYRGELINSGVDQVMAISKSVSLGVLLLLLAGFATRTQYFQEGRLVVALAWVFSITSLSIMRVAVVRPIYRGLSRSRAYPLRFLIVGAGPAARELVARLLSGNGHDLEPVGFLEDEPAAVGRTVAGLPVLGPTEMVELIAQEEEVDQLFVSVPSPSPAQTVELVSRCLNTGFPVRLVSESFRLLTGSPEVELIGGVPTIPLRESRPSGSTLALKRVMDVVISGLALILLAPLMGLISLLIIILSGPPVIFRQTRAGKDGTPFTLLKFRTMRGEEGDTRHRLYANALISGQDLALRDARSLEPVFKPPEDPRITTIGGLIRKTSLDELPQLVNVLKGDMSLVGPRPPILYELEYYKEWHRRRLIVKPGVTGLWQVYGRSRVPFDEMVWLDLCYIDNWSLLSDLNLLIRTVPVVLFGRGAY